jgi:lipopolysaccharide transport system ATP-binding protein
MSFDQEIAIEVRQLSKIFHIYEKPIDRLKQIIFPRLRRLFRLKPGSYCRDFRALDEVGFEVKKGGALGILGRNGAGKSTLLQVICGTLVPTAGHVNVHGRIAALLELGAGFNPEFTGRENVYMSASILGMSEEETNQRYENILAFADIGDFIEQPVKTYSSGMYVRLAFAVIAHVDADILIIDEALSVGDVFFTQKCMRFLREFKKKGTLLFVSHDTSSIVNFCDSCVWLDSGQVKMAGSAKNVTEKYLQGLYENEFVGSADEPVRECADADKGTEKSVSKQERIDATRKQGMDYDQRMDLINNSDYRNDIEIFQFHEAGDAFGIGGARVVDVSLSTDDGAKLSWAVGGEKVIFNVLCEAKANLNDPIVGFLVKDKLGQIIFGENTYLSLLDSPMPVNKGVLFQAGFSFTMPIMPNGDYSIAVAIAEGTQERHVQHHWIHDALVFKVHSSSVCFGLIGVPMSTTRMEIL